jgi:hypothetical protein
MPSTVERASRTVCRVQTRRGRGQVQTAPSVSSTSTLSSSPPMLGCCRTSDRRQGCLRTGDVGAGSSSRGARRRHVCMHYDLCVSRMSRCILRPTSSPLRPHAYPTLWFAGRPRWRGDGQLSSHQPPPGGRPRGFAMSCAMSHVWSRSVGAWCGDGVATVPVYVAYSKTQSYKNAIFFRHHCKGKT